MRTLILSLCISCFYVLNGNAFVYTNNDSLKCQHKLSYLLEFYKDTTDLSIYELRELSDNEFNVYRNEELKKDSIYWFRIVFKNSGAVHGDYFIHFNHMISNIKMYEILDDSIYNVKKSGAFVPLSQKADGGYLKDKLPFQLHSNGQTILYLRIYNQLENVYSLANLKIISRADFEKDTSDLFFIQGGFLGMMAILMIVNFVLFVVSHDKLYLYYSLYLLLIGLFFFNNFQFSERYLFFNYPKLDLSLYWSVYLAQFIYLLFFLELLRNENVPIWRRYLNYYAQLIFLTYIIILIIGQIDYATAVVMSDSYTLLNALFVIVSFFIFYKKVKLTTKIVMYGSLIMVIGAMITTIIGFSEVSVSSLLYYQLGLFIEFVLFTIAVNYTNIKERLKQVSILYQNSILELEKKQKEKENRVLLNEVDSKNRVLATKAMILSEKETLISDLILQLNKLKFSYKDKSAVQNLINNLKLNLSNNSWDEFETHFNEVHPQFYSTLSTKYPMLTPNERKLCAFLKLNLSTKEIATITGKSLNTIDVGRSRLRRKIGLANDENLQTVIANINGNE